MSTIDNSSSSASWWAGGGFPEPTNEPTPITLSVTGDVDGSPVVTWDTSQIPSGFLKFIIYCGTSPGAMQPIAEAAADETQSTLQGLQPGQYFVQVLAKYDSRSAAGSPSPVAGQGSFVAPLGVNVPSTVTPNPDIATTTAVEASLFMSVLRSSGAGIDTGPISVDVVSVDGTALAGIDYNPVNQTLNWEEGDFTEKLYSVGLLANPDGSYPSQFTLQLQNPVNCSLDTLTFSTVQLQQPPPPFCGNFQEVQADTGVLYNNNYTILQNNPTQILGRASNFDQVPNKPYYIELLANYAGPVSPTAGVLLQFVVGGANVLIRINGDAAPVAFNLNAGTTKDMTVPAGGVDPSQFRLLIVADPDNLRFKFGYIAADGADACWCSASGGAHYQPAASYEAADWFSGSSDFANMQGNMFAWNTGALQTSDLISILPDGAVQVYCPAGVEPAISGYSSCRAS